MSGTDTQSAEQTSATTEQKPVEQTTEKKPAEQSTTEQKPVEQTTTTEQKPAEQKPAEQQKPAGAPESYADFTLPQGVTLDAEVMGEFQTVAKELNLSQEAAQKLADIGAKLSLKGADTVMAALEQAKSDWTNASKTDKEFGGEKFDENLGVANNALKAFATPDFITFLAQSGLSQHPEMIRTFIKVGKAISPDQIHTGRQQTPDRLPGQGWYDHPTSRPAAK